MKSAPASAVNQGDRDVVFYDAACGFCDANVRLLLWLDLKDRLRFAPLGGETLRRLSQSGSGPPNPRPDSLLVWTAAGEWLWYSSAAIHIARRLGGLWGWGAGLAALVPRPLRDGVYRAIAAVRRSLAGPPRCSLAETNPKRFLS